MPRVAIALEKTPSRRGLPRVARFPNGNVACLPWRLKNSLHARLLVDHLAANLAHYVTENKP